MPETNATPKDTEVLLIRGDVSEFHPGRTLSSFATEALAECKRILEDDRGIVWSRVFDTTEDAYLDNSDETGRNEDRIKNAISNMAISMVFRDYSIRQGLEEDDPWTSLADYHEEKATRRLLDSKLDEDLNDSGTIDPDEEGRSGQTFLVK